MVWVSVMQKFLVFFRKIDIAAMVSNKQSSKKYVAFLDMLSSSMHKIYKRGCVNMSYSFQKRCSFAVKIRTIALFFRKNIYIV